MYYTLYRTTCLISGRIYIGVHETKDPNDKYLGSGEVLLKAIKKHGRKNFRKDVAAYFVSREEMYAMEKIIVNTAFLNRSDVYNAKIGGFGGIQLTPEQEQLRRIRAAEAVRTDAYRKKAGEISKITQKVRYAENPVGTFKGKKHTENSKKAISEKAKIHSQGERNSSFGRVFMYHAAKRVNTKVKIKDIELFLLKGWIKGRKKF